MLRRFLIGLAIVAVVLTAAWWGLTRYAAGVMDAKTICTGIGRVERKEHVVFSADNNSFVDSNGTHIIRPIGSEEFRLYFRVTDFGPYPDASLRTLNRAELERSTSGALRYDIVGRELFERTAEGDAIHFKNQLLGDDAMTWGIENPRFPGVR